MTDFEEKTLVGEHIRLNKIIKDLGHPVYLGQNLVLKDCILDLRGCNRRNFSIVGVELVNCEIRVSKTCRHVNWMYTQLRGCRFVGDINEHRFGIDLDDQERPVGAVENTDFTEAVLWDCDFLGVDIRKNKLPRWPTIALLRTTQTTVSDYGASINWPGRLADFLDICLECSSNATALCFHESMVFPKYVADHEKLKTFVDSQDFFL